MPHSSSHPSSARPHRRSTVVIAGVIALGASMFVPISPATAQDADVIEHPTYVDVVELGIAGSRDLLRAGTATSVELTHAYLARIDAFDDAYGDEPGLNSIIAVNPDALTIAAARDAERASGADLGPLHGVPILIKDLIDLEGMPTTNGAIAFAEWMPSKDAEVVARLEAAGAVIIAKTNLSEFAWSGDDSISGLGGEVHNPYDQSRTSGGSSGGTAAAVAASLGAGGLGSDTYGSIRTPSAHQALVGVRPTHGLVSLDGVTPQVEPQDTVGPMTLTVEDAAILLDVLAGPDATSATRAASSGYADALSIDALDGATILNLTAPRFRGSRVSEALIPARDEMLALQDAAVDELRAQGANVIDVALSDEQIAALGGRGWYGMAGYLDEYFAHHPESWPAGLAEKAEPFDVLTTADYIADGQAIESIQADGEWLLTTSPLDPDVLAAQDARAASALATWNALLDEYGADAAVFPTDALPASTAPVSYGNARNAWLSSGAGTPSVTVPVGYTEAGLPAGLEFAGRQYSEATLLALAYGYEQATHARIAPASTPALPLEQRPEPSTEPSEPSTEPSEPSTEPTEPSTEPSAEPTDPTPSASLDEVSTPTTEALPATGADGALPYAATGALLALLGAILVFARRRRLATRG